jgi:hypothetical protein
MNNLCTIEKPDSEEKLYFSSHCYNNQRRLKTKIINFIKRSLNVRIHVAMGLHTCNIDLLF